ncbi:MAG: 3-deoxy-D-manno-octulosonic acid transferase [Bacteroidales bacterium]|nr:3-deoxy-D-manno-octulosonic acid transferase [Bacteroidales bacterium]
MYSIFFQIYVWLFRLVALFHKKAAKMVVGQKQTFRLLEEKISSDDACFWMHVSSLGEFEQGRPLIEALRRQYPTHKIVLSFYSPSGYEVRKDYQQADVVCYLPFDTPFAVKRFYQLVHPQAAFFVKYDLWPNYLRCLRRHHIPAYLISGIFRPSQRYFWPLGSAFFRRMLKGFDQFFVQNQLSAELLTGIELGDKVQICGDTRCDRVLQVAAESKHLFMLDTFTAPHVLVAGSTWPQDEKRLIPYFNQHSDMKMIIAPHQVNESRLLYIESLLKRPAVRYSQLTIESLAQADCIIIDCYGLLSSLYRYGDMAYIGGGFGAGIHNTLEAAVYGIPMVFGPRYQKFDEAKALLERKAAQSIDDEESLQAAFDALRKDAELKARAGEAAKDYVLTNSGSTQCIMSYLTKYL